MMNNSKGKKKTSMIQNTKSLVMEVKISQYKEKRWVPGQAIGPWMSGSRERLLRARYWTLQGQRGANPVPGFAIKNKDI